jgi:hypothetical protein
MTQHYWPHSVHYLFATRPKDKLFLVFLLNLVLSGGGLFAQGALQNGLVACYTFSGDATDKSGGNHGTVNGALPTTDRFGTPNSAYLFDGADDHIRINPQQFTNNSYTYAFWAKSTTLPGYNESFFAFSIGGPGGDQSIGLNNIYSGNNTGWTGGGYNVDGTHQFHATGALPTVGQWYHLIVTRDNANMRFYVNGNLSGSVSTNGQLPFYGSSYTNAIIGGRSTLTQFYQGALDDISVYNRALSATEATQLYNAGSACTQVNLQNGLVGCYPFAGNALDATSTGNNGTVNGAALTTDRFGNANGAYAFDGIDDYISLNPAPLKNNNYTYSFWAKADAIPVPGNSGFVFSIGGPGGDQSIALNHAYSGPNSGWTGGGYNTDNTHQFYGTGVLPSTNSWYHLVVTRDAGTMHFYVNGQLTGSVSTGNQPPLYGHYDAKAIIGGRSTLVQLFKGAVDDLAIYNRALNAAEVTALFNGSACQAAPAAVPVPVATDAARCGNGTIILTASGGSQYRWYNTTAGDMVLHTGATFTTPVLTATTKYYVANVVNGRESARKEVSAIINPVPEAPVAADTSRCGNGTLTLTASGCHDYRWYDAQGTMLFSGLNFTTPVLSKMTTFYVSGVQNNCEGPRTPVKVTVHPLPSTPLVTASGPTAFCAGDSVVLSATPGCATYLWSTGETSQSIVVREPGSYSVKTSNYICNSCDRYTCESLPSKPVVVKVNALPPAPEIVQVCADTLRAVPAGKVFAWYRDGVLLPFTSRSILAEQTGSYTVKVRDTNGCFSEHSTPYAFIQEPACFTVYPNPNQGNFQVKVNGSHKVLKLEIVTLREGKLLWKTELPSAECRLNVSINLVLPKGIYLVKLHTRKGVFHQRVQIL